MTALVILISGAWTQEANGVELTALAFDTVLPGFGYYFVPVAVTLFAYSTLLSWSYYGERNIERLIGRRAVMPFRILFSLIVFIGCTVELGVVWAFSDVMNGLMALPNLIGLLVLSGLVARETKKYLDNDPKLRASKEEIDAFMQGTPGWEEWKTQAIPVVSERSRRR